MPDAFYLRYLLRIFPSAGKCKVIKADIGDSEEKLSKKKPTIICLRNDRNIKKWERNIKIQITFVEINTNILTNAQKCISLLNI
jgi:hypothetical protein